MNRRTLFGFLSLLLILLMSVVSYHTLAAPQAQLNVYPTPTPGPDGRIIYIVQEGDSLWRIAAIMGIKDAQTLRDLNHLTGDTVIPGQKLLIGYAGPAGNAPTAGAIPSQPAVIPSPTPPPGWGILCVLLYDDLNGDSMRQEPEPSIPGGEISVSNRLGTVSLTGETPSGGIAVNIPNATPQERGYVCFDQLLQGQYLISVAVPQGYNRTTSLNTTLDLEAGQTTQIAFGAQANSELEAQTAIIPESPRKSPLIGIIGGALLLVGVALGIYATLLRRASSTKSS